MMPIIYISGGALGDLIHQLSIINEIYIETQRKGFLYVRDSPGFTVDLTTTYNDTYSLISKQVYIDKYAIWQGENYDIYLSAWFSSPLRFKANFQKIYNYVYNIDWARNPWLTCDTINTRFESKIVFCCSNYHFRFPDKINFKKFFADLGIENIVFVTQTISEYNNFCEKTGITLDLYIPSSIEDFVTCINSCSLFIGNLSSPLTYAYALHKNRICLLSRWCLDNIHFIGLTLPHNELLLEYN
jgi:hypothetical protein